jgi:protein-disulfide isomerase
LPHVYPWPASGAFVLAIVVAWLVRRRVEERALSGVVLLFGMLLGVCGAHALTGNLLVTGEAILIGTASLGVVIPFLNLVLRWMVDKGVTVTVEVVGARAGEAKSITPPPGGSMAPASRSPMGPESRGPAPPTSRNPALSASRAPPASRNPTSVAPRSRGPTFSAGPSSRAVCKHGLHYDPATRSGCAKCERENATGPARTPALVWVVLGASVLSAAAAGLYWWRSQVISPPPLAAVSRAPSASPGRATAASSEPAAGDDIRPPSTAVRIALPPPTSRHPWKGVRDAPVAVQVFGDLLCPYTRRVVPTLERLIVDFPQKIRLVWRSNVVANRPLSRPALRVALAAFTEKGPGAFWNFQQAIDAELSSPDGLRQEEIFRHAAEQKLERARARKAFDGDDALDDIIEGDTELARTNGFVQTPVTVINGIVVRGVQPAHDYQNAVRQALEELGLRRATP